MMKKVAFSPLLPYSLATSSNDRTVAVWNLAENGFAHRIAPMLLRGHLDCTRAGTVSQDSVLQCVAVCVSLCCIVLHCARAGTVSQNSAHYQIYYVQIDVELTCAKFCIAVGSLGLFSRW